MNLLRIFLLANFLGNRVAFLLLISIGVGVGLSAVELLFAFCIQALLVSMRVMERSLAVIPDWIPSENTKQVLVFVLLVGFLRAVCQWAQLSLRGLCIEETKHLQRERILQWVYRSEVVTSSKAVPLFTEFVDSTSTFVMALQAIAVRFTTAIILIVTMAKLSLNTTLIVLAGLSLIALPVAKLNKTIYSISSKLKGEWENTCALLLRSIRNLILIRIYGTQSLEQKKASDSLKITTTGMRKLQFLNGLIYSLPNFIGMALICMIVLLAESSSTLKAGILMSFLYMLIRFSQLLSDLSNHVSYFLMNLPKTAALQEWWVTENRHKEKFHDTSILSEECSETSQVAIGWKIENLCFSYHNERKVLRGLSFTVHPNSIFLIQGASGSGKSTLLNLMLGISDANENSVRVSFSNNKYLDIDKAKNTLLKHVGYVGPEPFMIEGDIIENLQYGLHETPTSLEIEEALRVACCDFVKHLPAGLKHKITEQGGGLSAGQKQRLSLARALLRKPRALILDEGTANLDLETEQKIIESLKLIKMRATVIVVSHRNTYSGVADQVIILKE